MLSITTTAFNHGLLRTSSRQLSLRFISTNKKIYNLHKPVISSVYKDSHIQRQHYHQITTPLKLLPRYFSTTDDISKSIHLHAKDDKDADFMPDFKKGDKVMVEVIYFGPLGASVDVVAYNSHDNKDCINQNEPALGRGMILQREIDYFRKSRDMVDVVKYEILPAYVENISEKGVETRLDISLRPPGGKAKAQELGEQILERLKEDGTIDIGDKSTPEEINEIFPGSSKSAFKKAVSGLYRQGLVKPGPYSITLM